MTRRTTVFRHAARAAVVLVVAGVAAGTGVASAEPDTGARPVTVGDTFHIWLANPQQSTANCWKAAQDHNAAIDRGDFRGVANALDRVERFGCDVVPI